MRHVQSLAFAMVVVAFCIPANAAWGTPSTITLGDQDFVDGSILSGGSSAFASASAGEPAPFNLTCGSDLFAFTCPFGYTFTFAGPGSVSSASFTVSILDADGFLAGDQVSLFTVGGVDFTANLNTFLNTANTQNAQFNVFTFALPSSVFPSILAGNVPVSLTLTEPASSEQPGNLIGLDFSSLTFDAPAAAVPEPATLSLLGLGLGAAVVRRRIKRR